MNQKVLTRTRVYSHAHQCRGASQNSPNQSVGCSSLKGAQGRVGGPRESLMRVQSFELTAC